MTFQDSLVNRIRMDISLHKITSYAQLSQALQLPSLFELFPDIQSDTRLTVASFNALLTLLPHREEARIEKLKLSGKFHGEHVLDKHNWIPPKNPLQVVRLYPHQNKAVKDIAFRLFIENKRGIYLQAGAGIGKTYIYGQLIRWLFDKGWFNDCYSPFKCLIITKSAQETLVKQTEHVMVDFFGLRAPREVLVMSYDALRSSKGLSKMIKKEQKHNDAGELVNVYSWIQHLNPKLIIVDECQAARRGDSIQSKVIKAIAGIEDESMKVVFSSATGFLRVCEAEAICTNIGMEV